MGRHCPTPPPRVLASCAAVACFASGGGCPSGAWKETTAVDVAASAGSRDALVLVNAGANKGYAVGEWAQRFGGAGSLPVSHWRGYSVFRRIGYRDLWSVNMDCSAYWLLPVH